MVDRDNTTGLNTPSPKDLESQRSLRGFHNKLALRALGSNSRLYIQRVNWFYKKKQPTYVLPGCRYSMSFDGSGKGEV